MHSGEQDNGRDRSGQIEAAARHVIDRLVRFCLRVGLSPDALRNMVDMALTESQQKSKIGVGASKFQSRQDLADLAHVLSAWHTQPDYVDKNGLPRPLSRRGAPPSFEELARYANPSLDPAVTLQHLSVAGAVSVDTNQRIRVLRRELVIREWDELGSWSWHESARRLLETLEFNYTVSGIGRFERAARSERLPRPLLPVFNAWVREHAAEFLRTADDWLTQHEVRNVDDDVCDAVTTGIGVYLFVDDNQKSP